MKSKNKYLTILKVDIDNKNFKQYLKQFSYIYYLMKSMKHITIDYTRVYHTKNGIHIYYYLNLSKKLYNNYINLLECLLGSDVVRQTYFFVEDLDILFQRKNKYKEQYTQAKTDKLNNLIRQINSRKYVIITKTLKISKK